MTRLPLPPQLPPGPAAELLRRLGLSAPGVRRFEYQNGAGEQWVTEIAAGGLIRLRKIVWVSKLFFRAERVEEKTGLGDAEHIRALSPDVPSKAQSRISALRGYAFGARQWEWVEGNTLCISPVAPQGDGRSEVIRRLIFDARGLLIREEGGGQVRAEYHYDGLRLASASIYEQVSDRAMGWVDSTYLPRPPEQGGARREQVSTHAPDGQMSVELREYDAAGREIYNELYSNADPAVLVSRTAYRDDERGNWVEMCIRSGQEGESEEVYVHRRVLEYAPSLGSG